MRWRGRSPHIVLYGVFAGGLSCLAMAGAWAGAFLQPKGRALIITATTFDISDSFFDASGKLRRVSDYRKFEMQTYAEYGATDALTLIFATSASQSIGIVDDMLSADRYGRVDGGARAIIWSEGPHVLSAQAVYSYAYPIAYVGAPGLQHQLRQETSEADLRLLYGSRFTLLGGDGFLSAEAAWRRRARLGAEWRADLTLGWRPWPRLLLLAQNFNAVRPAMGESQLYRSHKLQISAVLDLSERWSIQSGVYATVAGAGARHERGVIGGLWRRF